MSEWRCHTLYTQCDNVWNCLDGRDELFCNSKTLTNLYCKYGGYFCLDVSDGHPICLSIMDIGDGVVDCIGSTDEREFCRLQFPFEYMRPYRCRNSNICIPVTEICNCFQNCPENDNETTACRWLNNGTEPICNTTQFRCHNGKYTRDLSLFRCHAS